MVTPFATEILQQALPRSIRSDVSLPRRQQYYPSPADWRDEVLYFLLIDRFSDGQEDRRPLLDRKNRKAARPPGHDGQDWRWDRWAESGAFRWQGGTFKGVESKLDYLKALGISTIWLSPVFRQRGHLDTFHGYGIQHFLDVDPHFGTRSDLVDLVAAAHQQGIRIILDIIFNHSGFNWVYPNGSATPAFKPFPQRYDFGSWLGQTGQSIGATVRNGDEGVWPQEFQDPNCYSRAGLGDLGSGSLEDRHAEHKRTDFFTLRDFDLDHADVLSNLAECYKYWIALTDCDGFRIDTLKHVSFEHGRNFCGTIKEFSANIGKANFLLVGEVAGGDFAQDRYLDVLGRNLDAALDIGGMRPTLHFVAKGLMRADAYFSGFDPGNAEMGSHRNIGQRHVSILDDHDHVIGEKTRFCSEATSDQQIAAAVAIQLFTLGIPCIYYGTEQSFAGPEESERKFLPGYKGGDHADRYLREAMFGPLHPRRAGLAGLEASTDDEDSTLPGFGPFGTAGAHCFQTDFPTYRRIAALTALRKQFPVLRQGRQYLRPIANFGAPFGLGAAGEIVAWSRILNDEEALCIVNSHGHEARGGDVIVDADLNPTGSAMVVKVNTQETANGSSAGISHPIGSHLPVKRMNNGTAYVEIRNVQPSEVLVLVNHP
ncbi:alpha-amylase family glycosyl hydrolase [Nitrosomonas sp. Nm166]|uniref:alpha-amylase family glycosyl hydrolase n=1 Tax=Nitrosomonas sp. Nm166 TaxID=1881054 RepID=UPI0008F17C23|nr:alpha-amylase family glycosyl hydrolase [Nitrosomonas sp. Nm166]SFD85899.1 Glycosidase [Nitrosomonas sp. Nm166]